TNGVVSRYKESTYLSAFVDADYFRIFDYQWLQGDPETVLANPNSVVLSAEIARKYFGDQDPLGKDLIFNSRLSLQVTGVFKEVPKNTDLPFHSLIRYDHARRGNDNWESTASPVQCYLKLPENVAPQELESRLDNFFAKYSPEEAKTTTLSLQPLQELHHDSRYSNYPHRTVSTRTLFALGLIGLFLVITACINFINLNTAHAAKRSKEVGVRKVLGSSRWQLMRHFLGETAVITFCAIILSLALSEVAFVHLESILGYRLELNLLGNISAVIFLAVLFVIVTLAAGFYPALHLSRYSPTEAIRNKISASYGEKVSLRKGLVALQFAISQVLIICTLVISAQIRYFNETEMGFTKEAVIEVELPNNDGKTLQRFKNQLSRHSGVKYVSFSNTGAASGSRWGGNYEVKIGDEIKRGYAQAKFIDEDFVETYELEIILGEDVRADTLKSFLVNEAFAKDAGFSQNYPGLLGKYVKMWGREAPIAAVVKDFKTTSLHHKLLPVIMMMQNNFWQAAIKIDLQNIESALAAIENAWLSAFPEFVFDYEFLDKNIEQFYGEEQRIARLINTFTAIAIIIGCLGLFGLVSYLTTQRTKEVGIRKVLGASFSQIVALFSREFAVLIVVAFIFAGPVAYYFMNSWLVDFAYRIDLGAGIFLLALLASFIISLFTVGYKSWRAALANPVEALRYE
ncbi:MAG: FtsX-like permease family protein, partial [bacterium]